MSGAATADLGLRGVNRPQTWQYPVTVAGMPAQESERTGVGDAVHVERVGVRFAGAHMRPDWLLSVVAEG